MPGGVLATSGEVGKASEEACGVLTVSNKIAPAAPKRVPFPLREQLCVYVNRAPGPK